MADPTEFENVRRRLEDILAKTALEESGLSKQLEAKQRERARLQAGLAGLNGEPPPPPQSPEKIEGDGDPTPTPRGPRLTADKQLDVLAEILVAEVGEKNPSGLTDRQLRKHFEARTGKQLRKAVQEQAAADPRFTRDAESGRWRIARGPAEKGQGAA